MFERLLLNNNSGGRSPVGGGKLAFYSYLIADLASKGWVPRFGDGSSSSVGTALFNFGQSAFVQPPPDGWTAYDDQYDTGLWVGGTVAGDGFVNPGELHQCYYDKVVNTGKRYYEVTFDGSDLVSLLSHGAKQSASAPASNWLPNSFGIYEGSFTNYRQIHLNGSWKNWLTVSDPGFRDSDTVGVYLDFDNNAVAILKVGAVGGYVEASKVTVA